MDAIHIYPSSLARNAALAELPDAVWTDTHVTFAEFAAQLAKNCSAENTARELDDLGKHLFLSRAAADCKNPAITRLFASENALRAASGLIFSWRSAGLTPQNISGAAKKLKSNPVSRTLALLGELHAAYEKLLGNSFADREGKQLALLDRLTNIEVSRVETVLHGFHRLNFFQKRVAEIAGAQQPAQIPVSNVFATKIEAAGVYEEVYEIGRRVRRWINDDKIQPSSIAVAFRDLGSYSQAVADVFKRLNIPYFERRGEPAAFQPLIRTALSAIDAVENGLDRKSVFRFLCSGSVHLEFEPAQLKTLALDAKIDRFFGEDAKSPASAWKTHLQQFQKSPMDRQAATLVDVIEKLESLRAPRSVADWAQAWRRFLAETGVLNVELIAIDPKSAAEDSETVAVFDRVLDSLAHIPGETRGSVSLGDFKRILNFALANAAVRASGSELSGVRVLSVYDLRGMRFQRLALGGMAEGVFPKPHSIDPLLGAGCEGALKSIFSKMLSDARAVEFMRPLLPEETAREESLLFQCALSSISGGELLLSRALADAGGKGLNPSPFWLAIEGIVQTADSINPAPELSECLLDEEREVRAAWVLGGGERTGSAERKLAAAFLKNSPRLKTASRRAAVEVAREKFFLEPETAAGAFDGSVSARVPAAQQAVAEKLLVEKGSWSDSAALSPSSLEQLANCPFRFLAGRLYRFEDFEEPDEEISRRDYGGLCHDVFAAFYESHLKDARAAGRIVAILDPARQQTYLKQLQQIAAQKIEAAPQRYFIGRPALWELQKDQLAATLRGWLDHELRDLEQSKFLPAAVEFKFGNIEQNRAPGLRVPIGQRELLVAGRMDRLDLCLDDPLAPVPRVKSVRVIDYKLGREQDLKRKIKPEPLESLETAQLPIYLRAAIDYVAALETRGRITVDWDGIWSDSKAGYLAWRELAKKNRKQDSAVLAITDWPVDLKQYLDGPGSVLVSRLRELMTGVLAGNFAVRPEDCGGGKCPARYVCRYRDALTPDSEGGDA